MHRGPTPKPDDLDRWALVIDRHDLGNGYGLGVAIDPDGSTSYWLLGRDPEAEDDQGCGCAGCAPHEQLGPLSYKLREQINPAPRCAGFATSANRRCRRVVEHEGDLCDTHTERSQDGSNVYPLRRSDRTA